MKQSQTGNFFSGLEVVPPGLEVVPGKGLEVVSYQQGEKIPVSVSCIGQAYSLSSAGPESLPAPDRSPPFALDRPKEGIKSPGILKRHLRALLAAAAVLAIVLVLAIALPLTLVHKSQLSASKTDGATATPSSTTSTATSTKNPYLSMKGAFNRTGLAGVDPLDGTNWFRLYFQHASGQIRESLQSPTDWTGGGPDNVVVASGAKNGTPLAAGSYALGNINTYHLFYLDQDNTIRDTLSTDQGRTWKEGTIGSHNFKAMDSPDVAFAFTYSDDWAIGVTDDAKMDSNGGIELLWGGPDNRIHQAQQAVNSTDWIETWIFGDDLSAANGIDFYIGNHIEWLWAIDTKTSTPTYYWRDNKLDQSNSSQHPIGTWVAGPPSASSALNNSRISYGGSSYMFFQDTQDHVIAILTNGTEGTSIWGAQMQVGTQAAISGTRMASHSVQNSLRVYVQMSGDTVTEFIHQNEGGGPWSMNTIPVGD